LSGNCGERAQFCKFGFKTGPEKMSLLTVLASFAAIFSGEQLGGPVSKTPLGECDAITKR
jgi:hypothetical protein